MVVLKGMEIKCQIFSMQMKITVDGFCLSVETEKC